MKMPAPLSSRPEILLVVGSVLWLGLGLGAGHLLATVLSSLAFCAVITLATGGPAAREIESRLLKSATAFAMRNYSLVAETYRSYLSSGAQIRTKRGTGIPESVLHDGYAELHFAVGHEVHTLFVPYNPEKHGRQKLRLERGDRHYKLSSLPGIPTLIGNNDVLGGARLVKRMRRRAPGD